MKKTLIAITLFLTQISFSQILETKDADNNALLFVGKIGEKLQNQLKKDTVFKNILKERLLLSIKKRERTLDYITNLNDYLKVTQEKLNLDVEFKMQSFFKDFSIYAFKYYYCDVDCAPIFNKNVTIVNDILVVGFGRKKQACDGKRFFKRSILLIPKQEILINEQLGVRCKFVEIDNYKVQKKLSDLIENITLGKANPSLFWELDSLIPKLIKKPLHDLINAKLNDNSKAGGFSKKDGYAYRYYKKTAANSKKYYSLHLWKKNDTITKISYFYPPEKQQDTINLNDLKMFLNNVEYNLSFYGLQEIGNHIFGTDKQKIMPHSYQQLFKKYHKYSNNEEDVYEFLDWSASNENGHGKTFNISIYVNKTSKQTRWHAIGESY